MIKVYFMMDAKLEGVIKIPACMLIPSWMFYSRTQPLSTSLVSVKIAYSPTFYEILTLPKSKSRNGVFSLFFFFENYIIIKLFLETLVWNVCKPPGARRCVKQNQSRSFLKSSIYLIPYHNSVYVSILYFWKSFDSYQRSINISSKL